MLPGGILVSLVATARSMWRAFNCSDHEWTVIGSWANGQKLCSCRLCGTARVMFFPPSEPEL